MNKQHIPEHLMRLSTLLRLCYLKSGNETIQCILSELDTLVNTLTFIHQSDNNESFILNIGETISVDINSLPALLASSKAFLQENKEGFDVYIMNKIISLLSTLIYKLKYNA